MYLNNLGNLRFCVFQICFFFAKAQKCLFSFISNFFKCRALICFSCEFGESKRNDACEACARHFQNAWPSGQQIGAIEDVKHVFINFKKTCRRISIPFDTLLYICHCIVNEDKVLSTHFDTFFIHLYVFC